MKKIIIINEKIIDNNVLDEEELIFLKQQPFIINNQEAKNLIELLLNTKTVQIIGTHSKLAIFHKLLEDNNILVLDKGTLKLSLNGMDDNSECDKQDLLIRDGLEEFIKSSQELEPLQKYTSKILENNHCKNSIAISLKFVNISQDDDIDEWEDKFDELGSQNPERDIKEYSNTKELLNRLSLEFKKKENNNYNKLKQLLDSIIKDNNSFEDIEKIRTKYRSENNYKKIYQHKRQLLISIAKDLSVNLQNESASETMQEVADRLETQEFSIGVTGIIKAGKSTMMNALLGQDILGTAIRPETANLTTIKKADNSKAIVHFWSKDEWIDIKNNALDEQSKEFVQVSENLDNFNNYISSESKSIDIDVEELDSYTSARQSENLCNLVKEVELQLPLKFLDGGVAIVDTPGIDDPIVQREKITLEYLSSCSAILHLMNAKQSATQKDIEFIGDALIDQGISSLLVVITRIDTLGANKQDIDRKLAEIILHAKTNLEIYLNKRSNDDISDILAKLEFLPLAGKFALQHRIGESEKALKKGYELKDTGILEIENYLNSMLFGEKNERAKLAISNAYRTIEHSANFYNDELQENYALVGLEKEEIDEKLNLIKLEKEEVANKLNEIFKDIKNEESRIKRYLENSKNTFELQFENFRKNLIDDISNFTIEKLYEGDKPDEDEIKQYVETELKEFISDVTQSYQKQAQIRLEDSIDYIDIQYSQLVLPDNVNMNLSIEKIDVLGDFTYTTMMFGIGGAIGFAGTFLLGPVGVLGGMLFGWFAGDAIDKSRVKKIKTEVDKKMLIVDKKLKKMNDKIHQNILLELKKYDDEIVSYFNTIAMQPANELQKSMQEKEETLKKLSANLISKEKSDKELKENLSKQIEIIKQNLNKLKEV